eukprot:TRINITY_DN758_c6_g1_i1.p1 TRINITY_DN758_c6_g1~~TRINITY_DN758_c6_g1_i1.p1  ORF type:complete len:275 (-),score=115.99 TRINITY_DN758_c6_g1_i1:761-1471(-)
MMRDINIIATKKPQQQNSVGRRTGHARRVGHRRSKTPTGRPSHHFVGFPHTHPRGSVTPQFYMHAPHSHQGATTPVQQFYPQTMVGTSTVQAQQQPHTPIGEIRLDPSAAPWPESSMTTPWPLTPQPIEYSTGGSGTVTPNHEMPSQPNRVTPKPEPLNIVAAQALFSPVPPHQQHQQHQHQQQQQHHFGMVTGGASSMGNFTERRAMDDQMIIDRMMMPPQAQVNPHDVRVEMHL